MPTCNFYYFLALFAFWADSGVRTDTKRDCLSVLRILAMHVLIELQYRKQTPFEVHGKWNLDFWGYTQASVHCRSQSEVQVTKKKKAAKTESNIEKERMNNSEIVSEWVSWVSEYYLSIVPEWFKYALIHRAGCAPSTSHSSSIPQATPQTSVKLQ